MDSHMIRNDACFQRSAAIRTTCIIILRTSAEQILVRYVTFDTGRSHLCTVAWVARYDQHRFVTNVIIRAVDFLKVASFWFCSVQRRILLTVLGPNRLTTVFSDASS